jgi:pSer/pThr/pTyr-binding forkhead associated (FHA) protein
MQESDDDRVTPSVFLKVLAGPDKGKGWELDPEQTYTIGRSRRCNLRLEDRTASGTHADIRAEDSVWRVTDLDSSHGTRVNRQRILAPKPVFDRDHVQVGKTLLEFREYEQLAPRDLEEIDIGLQMPQ